MGDGIDTVAQLVERVNADPRRETNDQSLMKPLSLDAEALVCLAEQSLTPESIPDSRRSVRLRRTANISSGGTAEDVTAVIHPELGAWRSGRRGSSAWTSRASDTERAIQRKRRAFRRGDCVGAEPASTQHSAGVGLVRRFPIPGSRGLYNLGEGLPQLAVRQSPEGPRRFRGLDTGRPRTRITRYGARARGSMLFHWLTKMRSSSEYGAGLRCSPHTLATTGCRQAPAASSGGIRPAEQVATTEVTGAVPRPVGWSATRTSMSPVVRFRQRQHHFPVDPLDAHLADLVAPRRCSGGFADPPLPAPEQPRPASCQLDLSVKVPGLARYSVTGLREIEDALRIAERSGDDLALAFARMALGVALVHRQAAGDRDRGQKLLADVSEVLMRRRDLRSIDPSSTFTWCVRGLGVEIAMTRYRSCTPPSTIYSARDNYWRGAFLRPVFWWRHCSIAGPTVTWPKPRRRSSG